MRSALSRLRRPLTTIGAVILLVAAMGGTWSTGTAAAAPLVVPAATTPDHPIDHPDEPVKKSNHRQLAGKLNLNTASEEQLMLLPTVGPAKAERVVTWRKKNGGFKRIADLRRVKGFGYKTFKKLEPFLDIKGDTTLAAR